jgi:hypothetical protein
VNDTQLLEQLSAAYASVPAPAPSPQLAALMDEGEIGTTGDPGAVVIPRERTRVRIRYLVAALVASFVVFSSLAAAGALPDAVQRQVSSMVSHLGIDLPSPDPGSGRRAGTSSAPHDRGRPTSDHASSSAPTTEPPTTAPLGVDGTGGSAATTAPPAAPAPATAPSGTLGRVGGVVGDPPVPTTLPPPVDTLLPPITVPQVTVPSGAPPPLALPPITIPPLALPSLPTLGL